MSMGEPDAMPTKRSPELQHFIDCVQNAILVSDGLPDEARTVAGNIYGALANEEGKFDTSPAQRLPVCEHLPAAFENAQQGPTAAAQLGEALAAIEPLLAWNKKPNDDSYFDGRHANAVVVGLGGIEQRYDARIGVSLVAPDTLYPDHTHPPQEVYAVLSDSAWRQNEGPWRKPGLGGWVYNPANISHAMRSYETPLLAVWSLWVNG